MNKQMLAVAVGAVVLFALALLGALAFIGDGSNGGNLHTMQNGEMMTGTTHTSP